MGGGRGWASALPIAVALLVPWSATADQPGSAAAPSTEPAGPPARENLAQDLQNPVANLISFPIQANVNLGLGSAKQQQVLINVQPVIPVPLGSKVNLISRIIVPLVSTPSAGGGRVNGAGDTLLSLFASPAKVGRLIWGVGPVQLLPTATADALGTGKYAIGPTGVALVIVKGWTAGLLANHLWSVAGVHGRAEVNQTFLQPFVAYTVGSGMSVSVSSEISLDWNAPPGEKWTVPLALGVSKLIVVGKLPVNLSLGGRYFVEHPTAGPEWGLRFTTTLVLPTGNKRSGTN